ncbi:hypothetical protein ACTJIL_05380 [Luteimonas sp. 22616]|jgi:hypothetical protein|uniref:hypothetical protein n=1 Tax=Luteimonas sp. 22616 TaxID=3453951 RepID=UPI003F854D86
MNKIRQMSASILLALAIGPVAAQAPASTASGQAKDAQTRQGTERDARREDMRREVEEASKAISAYSRAERSQALQRARSALDAMDRRVEDARRALEGGVELRSTKAHERRDRLLAELRRQRADAAERYRAMQDASEDTWERSRKQFVGSYETLAEKVRRLWDSADEAAPASQEETQPVEPEETGKRDN